MNKYRRFAALALTVIAALTLPQRAVAATTQVSLTRLLQICAPSVATPTMLALISVESGGWPWSIDDDTARKAYSPKTYKAAVALATSLIAEGHNLDVGLAQVNSGNFDGYGLSVSTAFDPCTNVSVGAMILTRSYQFAIKRWTNPQIALYHALQMYNSGRAFGDDHYALAVWQAALQR